MTPTNQAIFEASDFIIDPTSDIVLVARDFVITGRPGAAIKAANIIADDNATRVEALTVPEAFARYGTRVWSR